MFAVFGVTREAAYHKAVKKVPAVVNGTPLPLEEYRDALTAETERIFQNLKPARISSTYVNKREAVHFMNLARAAGGKHLVVKQGKTSGGVTDKKGKFKISWEEID